MLDVQTSNKEAIEFYKKHGFIQVREKPKYYDQVSLRMSREIEG